MRTRFLLAAGLATLAAGCTQDKTFTRIDDSNPVISPGQISGRVCDASGKTWLQDATVYTHVKERGGDRVIETRIAYTDRDGYFLLEELPGEAEYDVLIQFGGDTLGDQQKYGLWLGDGEDKVLAEPDCFDPLTIDVAIISGSYDSFELVLSNMGFANYTEIDGLDRSEVEGFLTDLTAMQSYDIIFFNGGHVEEGLIYEVQDDEDEPGLGGGEEVDTGTIPVSEEVMDNIRAYVEGGGSIYASDWAYDVVEQAYPDRLDFVGDDNVPDAAQLGEYDLVSAAVSDASMGAWLDKDYIEVEYDLPVWPPIETASDSVSVHLRGDVTYRQGTVTRNIPTAPMLVSFGAGEGKVVYSTFRVAKNANSDVLQVLQYMMYNL
ncbi:MAG: hypothetical protein H6742_12795 [Alphaproteobacteria bacterium]|nr:hypothetical protein [Alphaproteobacteria bacterium]